MALIAILANHPEIQTRMQREIDEKIGDAEPRLKDKDQLHYVNAVCYPLEGTLLGPCGMSDVSNKSISQKTTARPASW